MKIKISYLFASGRDKYLADSRSLTDLKLPRFTNIVSDTTVREGGTVALQVAVKGRKSVYTAD